MKIVPIDGMRAREQTVSLGEMEIRIKDEFTTEKVDRTTEERVWVNALEAEVVCFVRTCIREVTWVGVAGWSESEEGVGGGLGAGGKSSAKANSSTSINSPSQIAVNTLSRRFASSLSSAPFTSRDLTPLAMPPTTTTVARSLKETMLFPPKRYFAPPTRGTDGFELLKLAIDLLETFELAEAFKNVVTIVGSAAFENVDTRRAAVPTPNWVIEEKDDPVFARISWNIRLLVDCFLDMAIFCFRLITPWRS